MSTLNREYFHADTYLVSPNLHDRGENGILFRAYLEAWYAKLCKIPSSQFSKELGQFLFVTRLSSVMSSVSQQKINYFRANPPEDTTHFSVDNMTGLYYMSQPYHNFVDKLPVLYWNGRFHWHPNGWMTFLSAKHGFFKYLFAPFLSAMSAYSFLVGPASDTSGRDLWWLRFQMLGMRRTEAWANSVLQNKVAETSGQTKDRLLYSGNGQDGFVWSFAYYLTSGETIENEGHPLMQLLIDAKQVKPLTNN